jgi:hypothetical protein
MDFKEMKWEVVDWIQLAQDWDKKWAFTNTAMDIKILFTNKCTLLLNTQNVKTYS